MSKHKKHDKTTAKKHHKEITVDTTNDTQKKSEKTHSESVIDQAKKVAETTSTKAKQFAHDAEETIDTATKKAKAYVSGQGKKDFKELEQETVSKVNKVAEGVEHLGEGYEDLVESLFPSDHQGSRIVYNAQRNEEVDRWVVVRLLWCIVLRPVLTIWGAWIALVWIIYMIKIITTGKRDRLLWNKMIRFANYILNRDAYMGGLIDRRPEIVE